MLFLTPQPWASRGRWIGPEGGLPLCGNIQMDQSPPALNGVEMVFACLCVCQLICRPKKLTDTNHKNNLLFHIRPRNCTYIIVLCSLQQWITLLKSHLSFLYISFQYLYRPKRCEKLMTVLKICFTFSSSFFISFFFVLICN